MGWATIYRLTAVYVTIRASIGYWLLNAARWSSIVRRAITCARYTARMCPRTIAPTLRNHANLAFDQSDVDPVVGRPKDVPPVAEWVRRQEV